MEVQVSFLDMWS